MKKDDGEEVKENIWRGPWGGGGVGVWPSVGLVSAVCALLLLAHYLTVALPSARTAPDLATHPDAFNAELAHKFLVNLTSIGPRVSGSYECDVSGIEVAVGALRAAAASAGPHNTVDIDVHRANGFFNLTFFDGMNNAYRGVVSAVGRVRARGAKPQEPALLLNCHIDTVPDSPGASDDGAGCAVVWESARALAASPLPLPRPLILLFNGAEESIMQGSHAFVTTHPWARTARAFLNVEACGSGGREVVFQASGGGGGGGAWLLRQYAATAPHPFASSFAQEIFQGGLVPADTDFRVFRDFGHLAGLDVAWHVDGYVYHTALDTVRLVPPPVLQRTGDNILALANGIIRAEALSGQGQGQEEEAAPVYFDVLGRGMLLLSAPLAATLAAALLALLAVRISLNAAYAAHVHAVSRRWWYSMCLRATACVCAAAGAGVCAGAAVGAALHCAHARLPYYTHPLLLLPLYVLPACLAAGYVLRNTLYRSSEWSRVCVGSRVWWAAHAGGEGAAIATGAVLAGCLLRGTRSGFLPATWLAAAILSHFLIYLLPHNCRDMRWRVWVCTAVSAAPTLQTMYLAVSSVRTLVPILGRAGVPHIPPDVCMGAAVALLALWCASGVAPALLTARRPALLALPAAAVSLTALVFCVYASIWVEGWPYSATRPQRLMVFHVSRTYSEPGLPDRTQTIYWVPELDINTEATVRKYLWEVERESPATCGEWVYCGAPYYLPVRSLVRAGLTAPATAPPLPAIAVQTALDPTSPAAAIFTIRINGTGVTQTTVVVSVSAEISAEWAHVGTGTPAPPLPTKHGGPHNVYFFFLTDPTAQPWTIKLHLQRSGGAGGAGWSPGWGQVCVSGHAMSGPAHRTSSHTALLARLPPHLAPTGWGVAMHLIKL